MLKREYSSLGCFKKEQYAYVKSTTIIIGMYEISVILIIS